MGGAERVVFALGALGEAGEPAAHAQRADAVAPAGQDLVRIGLVADVPDQAVVRRVEHIVQRDRQLDHAEPGAEMAAGDRDRVDGLLAQLVGDLPQLIRLKAPQIRRRLDLVEQGGLGRFWTRVNSTTRGGGNLTGWPEFNQTGLKGQIRNSPKCLMSSRFSLQPVTGTRARPGRFS